MPSLPRAVLHRGDGNLCKYLSHVGPVDSILKELFMATEFDVAVKERERERFRIKHLIFCLGKKKFQIIMKHFDNTEINTVIGV